MADRNTPYKEDGLIEVPVYRGTKIEAGKMVVVNASGFAVEAANAAGLSPVLGRCDDTADNSGGSDGDIRVRVRRNALFLFENTSNTSAVVTLAQLGDTVYAADDETVSRSVGATNGVIAGKCLGVGADGVWVKI